MIVVFSDCHLQPSSADVVLKEVLPGLVEAAKQASNAPTIICLGDFYHLRYRLDVWLQNAVVDFLTGFGGQCHWHFLPGNHDQIDLEGRNALEALGALPNVTVYTQPTETAVGLFLPYRRNARELVPHIAVSNAPVCFIHHGFEGAQRNNGTINDTGMSPKLFSKFRLVLSGHYHKRHKVGSNIWYIGSPYETRADEAADPHGFLVTDFSVMTWIDMAWGPSHHKVWVMDAVPELPTGTVLKRGDVVRAYVSPENAASVAKQLTEAGVTYTLEHQATEAPKQRLSVPENASLMQYAEAYVDEAATTLDKGKLMGVLRDALGVS